MQRSAELRHIKAQMKMYVIFLFSVLCSFSAGLVRQYFFVDVQINWTSAQQHCRNNYRDLATVSTSEENDIIRQIAGDKPPASWIGLYRSSDQWLWSDSQAYFFSWWKSDQPNKLNIQNCVVMEDGGWNDNFCWEKRPFFCEKILVLVKENKTWVEAYEHCRSHYTGLAYLSSDNMDLAKEETQGRQTVSVWTGLRFLAGHWLWVNG
ncbi:CD209 antigen-like protein E, partial [Astyanax mexicanus]|uniref:CD209 antigen-like protein E n=1 Tax=Astyanax mexicanus TaxID=7994 RepID=UPI0020CAF547